MFGHLQNCALRSAAALDAIRAMSKVVGATVGAGTLLSGQDVRAAKEAVEKEVAQFTRVQHGLLREKEKFALELTATRKVAPAPPRSPACPWTTAARASLSWCPSTRSTTTPCLTLRSWMA